MGAYSDLELEMIAIACHMANRAYCIALGDMTQPMWGAAPDWQKSSARSGVRMALDNPSQTPEDSHKSWMDLKLSEGWKYGPVKDADKKEHPCIKPYSELPEAQRRKDDMFLAMVHEYRLHVGRL